MSRLYPMIPVLGAAGFLLWSASRLIHEIRHEVVR